MIGVSVALSGDYEVQFHNSAEVLGMEISFT
jgi:hypothetical protein